MRWEYQYHPAARWHLLNTLGPVLGARLDAAVIELARSGRGQLTKIEESTPTAYRLRVAGAEADLFLDAPARRFWVIHVRRARRT
jgi:hypothetical protein